MRVLLISDVHANLAALEEVLADAETFLWNGSSGYDAVWSLGDIVGYGPHPNECIERLKLVDPEHVRVAGNHDWAALDFLDINDFNPEARKMVEWTQENLDEVSLDYLKNLHDFPLTQDKFTVTHASPRHPIWEYITSISVARENFDHFNTPYCLVGHTHVPLIFRLALDPEKQRLRCSAHSPYIDRDINLAGEHRLILNPGSVGQPRDNDPRAAYALLDTESDLIHFRRVRYDIEVTQAAMRAARHAGAPDRPPGLWLVGQSCPLVSPPIP